jgi:NitT/TauT family transport system permease protein
MVCIGSAQLAIVLLVLIFWQFFPDLIFDESLIGQPSDIALRTWTWLREGVLLHAAEATLTVVFFGLLFGGLAGFYFGTVTGFIRPARNLLEPAINAFSAMPKAAMVPLFILWYGVGVRQQVIFTALVVFFFYFHATLNGIKSVPSPLHNMLTIAGASAWQRYTILYVPASFNWLLAGTRLAIPHAFTAAITTEVIASRDGLGQLVKASASELDPDGVFSAVLTVIVLATISAGIVIFCANRLRWRSPHP